MNKPNPHDYSVLFQGNFNASGFMCEVFMHTSLAGGNILLIQTNDTWNTFMLKEKEQECLTIGLELFSSKEKYQQYASDLRQKIKEGQKLIQTYKKIPNKILKRELQEVFSLLGSFWYAYGFTEFPYHDLAYKELEKANNPLLKKNLTDFAKLKFEGRAFLNAVAFERGIIPNIITSLSKTFFQDNHSAHYLFFGELMQLLNGEKIPSSIVTERKEGYTLLSQDRKIIERFTGKKHLQIAQKFLAVEESSQLQGVPAHPGKVHGTAIIVPMLMNIKEVHILEKSMHQGDILIAQTTGPELMNLCHKAAAIVTDQGGMLSHAAVISREFKIPCIVGTINATKVFKDGDLIEVDANQGIVKKLKNNINEETH